MSDLKLYFPEDGTADAGPGQYSDHTLQLYLQGKTSLNKAAKEITALLPEPKQRKTRPTDINGFGEFLCQMAEQIPYNNPAQTRLVQLIQRVSHSPKLTGQGDDEDGFNMCFTMDNFKGQLREWFHPDFEYDVDNVRQYSNALNFAAFLARLTQSSFLGYSPFPIWAMRESLEEAINDKEILDCSISSAALWIILASQAIYAQVVEAPFPKEGEIYKPGELYTGSEMGLERWKFWKKALAVGAERQEASNKCQRLARGAVNLMDIRDHGFDKNKKREHQMEAGREAYAQVVDFLKRLESESG